MYRKQVYKDWVMATASTKKTWLLQIINNYYLY